MMDDKMAEDYAVSMDEHCKALLLKADDKRWTRTDNFIDKLEHPFVSANAVAQYLESANLAEVTQGRMGNCFDCLIVRLNERGAYLKNYLLRCENRKGEAK